MKAIINFENENMGLLISACLTIIYFRKTIDILKLIYDYKIGHLN